MATILDSELDKQLIERLKQLPKVVQNAVESADIQKHLRDLANTHQLHLDQWQKLENEVMLTLLAFEPIEDLQKNIRESVGVGDVTAAALAEDISRVVFEPIRQELERELEHPEAKAAEVSGVEAARTQEIADEKALASEESPVPTVPTTPVAQVNTPPAQTTPVAPPESISSVQATTTPAPATPATPPVAPPIVATSRVPTSSAYKAGEPSAVRKTVHDDPYREAP